MDPYNLFLIILMIYIAVLVAIGLLTSKRQRSVTDFWLAGRELGIITIGFSAASSWVTASALLLATGLFILMGMSSIWVWVFPNIAALIVIAAISGRIKNIPALTQPELMEIRYDPMIRAPVALAIAIMMVLFSVVDFIGFKLVLGTFFGVQPLYAILIMAASIAFYVSIGGFRAVVWTDLLQYVLLTGLVIFIAAMAIAIPVQHGVSLAATALSQGSDWWNPFVIGGVLGALIFQLALMPGWIAEQDPWQKIWAARDDKAARRGLLFGAVLLSFVYLCCLLTAIGLRALYPLPEGEIEAEMLYLKFLSDNISPSVIALLTIGFAAASMSCTDTFATSGASCISRDIVQRHIWPAATMHEMMVVNRILVVVMIALSAFIALNVDSIMDAVIIATVIGTTSYFFPIIGGLYWRRATKWGALTALIAGGLTQMALIAYELLWIKEPLSAAYPQFADLLTEHGVLIGLLLSALFFVAVSLATPATEGIRLAPFFPDVAEALFGDEGLAVNCKGPRYREILALMDENVTGDRAHLRLNINLKRVLADGAAISGDMRWDEFVERLKILHQSWYTPTGSHIAYRLSQADMLACVKMVRGDSRQIWLSAEPRLGQLDRQKNEIYLAYEEIENALLEFGLIASPSMI
jgi:SSS family solute:Na+ symporter